MTQQEATQIIDTTFTKIKTMHDNIINATRRLDIILINLQIENTHINQATGIEPIAKSLERIIDVMRDEVVGLVNENRSTLNEALEVIKNCK